MIGICSGRTYGRAESVVVRIDPRTPLAIARSSARHDGRDWDVQGQRLLHDAIAHTGRVRAFQQTLTSGFHVFQLEAIHVDPAAFVDDFCRALEPLDVPREDLLRFVSREGGYR